MEKDRTARFPDTDSAESDSVTVFKYLLNTDKVKYDSNERDKIPAVDGDVYLVNRRNEIRGKLLAQVKKLPDDNRDSPKKRFKTSTLNHYTVDPAPFLLVVVDIKNEVAYWVHADADFVRDIEIEDGQKTKTVHFPEENRIDGVDEAYISEWNQIVEDRLSSVLTEKDYQDAYNELRERANPAVGKEKKFYYLVHQFLDEYNQLAKQHIPVLNARYYANAWKIGIAIQQTEAIPLSYGLYPIPWSRNDTQIKEVEKPVLDELEDALSSVVHYRENPIRDHPRDYARKKAHGKIEEVLENKWLVHGVNRFLAREFIFEFVDEFSSPLGLDQMQNKYTIGEIKQGFYQYLPFWLDEATELVNRKRNHRSYYNDDGVDLGTLQTGIMPDEEAEISQRARSKFNQPNKGAGSYYISNRRLPARSFEEFIAYLEQQGIETIERPYIPQDTSYLEEQGGGWIWEGYSPSEVGENLETFYSNIRGVFRDIVEVNFTGLAEDLQLFDRASRVIITYEVKESYESYADAPTMSLYLLDKDQQKNRAEPDITIYHDNSSRFYNWKRNKMPGEDVKIDGEMYSIEGVTNSSLSFLFEQQPTLNYVYKKVGEKIGEPLSVNKTILAGRP